MAKSSSKILDWDFCFSLIMITLGAVMAAIALKLILIPNSMIDGGMNGGFNYFKYIIWWFTWTDYFYC